MKKILVALFLREGSYAKLNYDNRVLQSQLLTLEAADKQKIIGLQNELAVALSENQRLRKLLHLQP